MAITPAEGIYNSYSGSDIQAIIVLPLSVHPSNFITSQISKLESRRQEIINAEEQLRSQNSSPVADRSETFYKLLLERNLIDQQLTTLSNHSNVLIVGNLQTVTYSVYRDKRPVRALGTNYAKGYTRGGRTISGTLVFTVFDRAALREAIDTFEAMYDQDQAGDHPTNLSYRPVIPDQLPPFNIILRASNEYGSSSKMALLGVELFNEGMVMSIEDLVTENTFEYVARHYEPLESVSQLELKLKQLEGDSGFTGDYFNRIEYYLSSDNGSKLADRILERALNPYA